MHDTHLFEKIYQSIEDLCKSYAIVKINEVSIVVQEDSHIDEKNLLLYLHQRNNQLVGDWTIISLERKQIGELTAILKIIDGIKNES